MKLTFLPLSLLAASLPSIAAAPTQRDTNLEYEYVIVGSGAGGGPLACRLAMAGHKTLLIESGNDQGSNVNVSYLQGHSNCYENQNKCSN
jgi:choline dehydrogenase